MSQEGVELETHHGLINKDLKALTQAHRMTQDKAMIPDMVGKHTGYLGRAHKMQRRINSPLEEGSTGRPPDV